MSRWFILLAVAGGLIGCASEGGSEDESFETLQQQAVDGSVVMKTSDAGVTSVATEIGKACMADSDCKAPAAKCQKLVSVALFGININYPGGYCTAACSADAACGPGAGCPMASAALLMPALSSCLKRCDLPADCREGYSCAVVPALTLPGFGGAASAPTGPAPKHCLPPLPNAPGAAPVAVP